MWKHGHTVFANKKGKIKCDFSWTLNKIKRQKKRQTGPALN